jgi:hypothetical protein
MVPKTTQVPEMPRKGTDALGKACQLCDGTGEIPVHEEPAS